MVRAATNCPQAQSKNRWISVFVFSAPVQRWALNAIYSFVRHGKARSYLVATLDEQSLQVRAADNSN